MPDCQPRVSIGVPVYNAQRFLAETLDSLLSQTYTDFEIVISDNGSTDGTEEICRTYAAGDERIHYHRQKRNRGGSWNFRRVFELSVGEYFKWAAYDDLIAPTYLERCVGVLDSTPDAALCYPRTVVIDENGREVRDYNDNLNLRSPSPFLRYRQYHYRYRYSTEAKEIATNPIFSLMRRDVLEQTPLIAPYVNSDVNLIGELALRGMLCELPERLFFRRDHPQIPSRVYRTHREWSAWLSSAGSYSAAHPGWRMVYEEFRAVSVVPMRLPERLLCYAMAALYFLWTVQGSVRNLAAGVQT